MNGDQQTPFICGNNTWAFEDHGISKYLSSLSCLPRCSTKCQNGGSCIAPGKCSCNKGWFGRFCEKILCTQDMLRGNINDR